jgi:uncharacterized protein (DUF2384 family)
LIHLPKWLTNIHVVCAILLFPGKHISYIISCERKDVPVLHVAHPASPASDSSLVSKALIRAADRLNVNNKILSRVIGVSEATVSRMKKGEYPLEPDQKAFQLGVLFIRLYRSLDALTGGDDEVSAKWLVNTNTALDGRPLELVQTVSGLVNVIGYLDARRALV